MIVVPIDNVDDIKQVLCNPSIYDTITDDNCPNIEEFEPPISDEYLYVGGYVDDKIIGLMIYQKYLDGNECHVQVLPEHRKEHAKEFGEQSLMFRGTQPLYAEIPDLYKNVLDFALLNNFKVIKRIKDGFIKSGVNYTVNVLRYK
tara:strand:+ start:705 stop:1139 length:435 start_codon:yes stop_codon:yes gene_type:complete